MLIKATICIPYFEWMSYSIATRQIYLEAWQRLLCLLRGILATLPLGDHIYGDLPGHWASESPQSTIPPEILATSAWPDMIIIRLKEVLLLELSVPHNSQDSLFWAKLRKIATELSDDTEWPRGLWLESKFCYNRNWLSWSLSPRHCKVPQKSSRNC